MKKLFFMILIGICLIIEGCDNKQPLNFPNKRSEMAIAMHEMTVAMIQSKASLNTQKVIPLNFPSLRGKQFTDSSFATNWFDPMAEVLITNANIFDQQKTMESYQTVLANCQSCHELTCPGPMDQIRKLY